MKNVHARKLLSLISSVPGTGPGTGYPVYSYRADTNSVESGRADKKPRRQILVLAASDRSNTLDREREREWKSVYPTLSRVRGERKRERAREHSDKKGSEKKMYGM